jgi:CubicO group peptidase (beta-lactamase class C family)
MAQNKKKRRFQKRKFAAQNLPIPQRIVGGKKRAGKLAVLCFVFFISLFSGKIQAQTEFSTTFADDRLKQIRDDLQAKVEKREAASIAVGVVRDGKIIWKETFGWADRERNIKADSRTIYPLASLSKSITATGLWLLVEKGKLSADDPVEKHLKSAKLNYYQGNSGDLKIRHLLNMEGGIAHQFEYFYDHEKEETPSLKEQIRRYGFVAFPPGKIHFYSNFSLAIVDQIISDVSGKSFADFMKREIFKPLGMNRTFVERPSNLPVAAGYDSKGSPLPAYIFLPRGGAGMYSSLDDLLQYGLAHLNRKRLLKKETLAELRRTAQDAPNPYYASGWGILPVSDGGISLLSNGAIAGAAATLLVIPNENLAIVCLTNTTVGNEFTDNAAFRVAGALVEGYSESLENLIKKVEPSFAGKPFAADESLIGEWQGEIKTREGDFPIRISFKSGDRITVSLGEQKEETVKNARLENGLLVVQFKGAIRTAEALKAPHQISLKLLKIGTKLVGAATARSDAEKPKFFLPYYVELKAKDQ